MENYIRAFLTIVRYLLPVLSVLLLFSCGLGLLNKKKRSYRVSLLSDDMKETPVEDGEFTLGSGEDCDIIMDGLEENHCVISVCGKDFAIRPIFKAKIGINKHSVKNETEFYPDDIISAGDRQFSLRIKAQRKRDGDSNSFLKAVALGCLSLLQFFIMLSLMFAFPQKAMAIAAVFVFLLVFFWLYLIITKFKGTFIEIPVMFLLSIGMLVVSHNEVGVMIKQLVCLTIGFIGAVVLCKILSVPKRALNLRFSAFVCGIVLFSVNMVFGVIYNGAQNWLNIAGFSFQPSELIKVILVFISGASVEKLGSIKDSIFFIAFSVFCLVSLAYLSDFGTALIYGVVLITVIAIRFCSVKLLALLGGAAVIMGTVVMLAFPYVAKRIFSFGQAWQNAADSGYQQTRAMIATASGGLFGVGAGNGTLIKVSAADTDIVFGLISEELGIIVSLCALSCFAIFTLYAIKVLLSAKSTYYGVTACAAAILLLIQASLNVFGSLDMLPFTGVTLPFISNGGSSLISCIMLTAFLRTPLVMSYSKAERGHKK